MPGGERLPHKFFFEERIIRASRDGRRGSKPGSTRQNHAGFSKLLRNTALAGAYPTAYEP